MEGGLISKLECGVKREKRSRNYSSSDDDQEDSRQGIIPLKDIKLEMVKAEMGEVKEENQRLKKHLSQIMEEYKNLHKKFRDTVDHQQELQGNESASTVPTTHHEHDLVSLCLGRTSAPALSINQNKNENHHNRSTLKIYEDDKEELSLGLACKFDESPTIVSGAENSVEEVIREEICPPGKFMKKDKGSGDAHEAPQQNTAIKKTRVSVRARCDTPTMNDGCQWRKYGQKISKGNPCPRAYYRCTVSTTCPVRKQVQRCAQEMSILTTTYEGTHNHPLSMSATAMASTTSAAASMLMSGSSTSCSSNPNNPSSIATPAELHGINFYLSNGSKPNPYYPQNPTPSCPTITLDLTSNPNFLPIYSNSTTNLNFGSWNNMNGALIYGTNSQQQPYIKNNQIVFGRHPQENVCQSYMQKNSPLIQQSFQANTIEAATKAITSDPNFQSILQAALTSIINSSGNGSDDKLCQNIKLVEGLSPLLSSFPSTSNANKSTPSENLPNSSLVSSSKSKSTSPYDS